MPSRDEITYFGAGPAALPTSVLERASQSILNHADTGLGLAEHSHRSALSTDILNTTTANLKKLLEIPEGYTVIYTQGGGTGCFASVAYNIAAAHAKKILTAEPDVEKAKANSETLKAEFFVTGTWSSKARQEARRLLGENRVSTVTDAKAEQGKFGGIPSKEGWKLRSAEESLFVYYCDNETVDGVEFPEVPKVPEGSVLVADMSSNILSRKVDVSKFGVVFGGAQKNVGSTGITLIIVRNDLLDQATDEQLRSLNLPLPPIIMHWPTLAKNNSLYNTLPIFDVWIAGEVISELLAKGGLSAQEAESNQKSELLYAALEKYPDVYRIVPEKSVRSRMNICFRIRDEATEKVFLKGAEEKGLLGLKGHRSVGGIRISNYNSIPLKGAEKLAAYLEGFASGLQGN